MENLDWRLRITVLWIFLAVSISAAMILYIMSPGIVEEIINGEMEGMEITSWIFIIFALFWLIPLIMAFLTLVLKESINRWSNFIIGLFFLLFLLR